MKKELDTKCRQLSVTSERKKPEKRRQFAIDNDAEA